jgi:hypothetical protein
MADILRYNGLEPAPERQRKTTSREFLAQHWELIVAADFFSVEVWTRRRLQKVPRPVPFGPVYTSCADSRHCFRS